MTTPGEFSFRHCEENVRSNDGDRYLATLFAPADKRPFLFALYAFNLEIARVRETIHETMAGEIRLQWWRDALNVDADASSRANPVADALLQTIERFSLPRETFQSLIDAHVFDLYDDPMRVFGDLEGYCGETSSSLMRLGQIVLAGDGGEIGSGDAAGYGGVAYAITGLLRAFPWHARRGQVFLPEEMMRRRSLSRDEIVRGRNSERLRDTLRDLRVQARSYWVRAKDNLSKLPETVKPALLPMALVEPYLRFMEQADYDPFHRPVELPSWKKQWALWRAARTW